MMSIGSKRFFIRRHVGQAVFAAFGLLVCHISLPVASFGAPPRPITFGQTIAGTLTSTDNIVAGRPAFDTYSVVTQAPNQSYVITAISPNIPLFSDLKTGTPSLFGQAAFTTGPGQQVQYSGTLRPAGRYLITVSSSNLQQPVGSYTLSLTHKPAACPPAPAAP